MMIVRRPIKQSTDQSIRQAIQEMPSMLQKLLPAPAAASASDPTTSGDDAKARRQSQTYAIDIVQTVRVTSDEPLTRRKIDAVKKSLGQKLGDRGCVSDDDAGAAAIRVVQTALEVVTGGRGGKSSTGGPLSVPSPLPRPHSASSALGGSGKQIQKQSDLQAQFPPKRILFYHAHDPYYGFTNFSPDPVEYRGKRYPTSEHLFQSLKFLDHRPELAEHIRTCSPRPRVVFDETHRFNPEVRTDWLRVRVDMMDMVLWHKFTQNEHLKRELLSTGDAELVEDSDKDAFWGVGPDGKGENQLGKALQRLRTKLRDNVATKPSQQR